MPCHTTTITRDGGDRAEACAPLIVSASRRTDIPAFYAPWFFDRLQKGYCAATNPFNGRTSFVSLEKARFVVFWSKNPKPLVPYLHLLDERQMGYYLHFTLNDYEREGLEPCVPPLVERVDTFRRLVDQVGVGRVIWRFDPLLLTDCVGVDDLLRKVGRVGDQLRGYTEKLVVSFADVATYARVRGNLRRGGVRHIEFNHQQMHALARGLAELNGRWHLQIATCAEEVDLREPYGIAHNRCVDEALVARFGGGDEALMRALGIAREPGTLFDPEKLTFAKKLKDPGQRPCCGCMVSKDIGSYDTCPHGCLYCYANSSPDRAALNHGRHDPLGELLRPDPR